MAQRGSGKRRRPMARSIANDLFAVGARDSFDSVSPSFTPCATKMDHAQSMPYLCSNGNGHKAAAEARGALDPRDPSPSQRGRASLPNMVRRGADGRDNDCCIISRAYLLLKL